MNQFQDIIKKERKDAARLLKPYLCTELRINKKNWRRLVITIVNDWSLGGAYINVRSYSCVPSRLSTRTQSKSNFISM